MTARRTAQAVWEGDLIKGHGTVHGAPGALPTVNVSWAARTEQQGTQTSPEELLAAAHASCFSMALAAALGRQQHHPTKLDVTAVATFDKIGEAWKITTVELTVVGHVPGITPEQFQAAAKGASEGCPVSQALKGNVAISVSARLA